MRRFPAPWTVEAIAGGFEIVDANGQILAYVYGHADPLVTAQPLTLDEARRLAANIAKLPPPAPTPRSDQEKTAYLRHLDYEVGMLIYVHMEIAKREPGNERNAFIECFALHARSLHEFLTSKRHWNQNAVAQDFVESFKPTQPDSIGIIIKKIHEQILHTGWSRIDDRNIKFDAGADGKTVLDWIVGWWAMFDAQLPPELVALVRD